jgi:two-component system, NarL family, sensor kinase
MMVRYGVAVVSVIVALFGARWLESYLAAAPVSLFLCAVMFSFWFAGAKPGLLALALSVLAFKYYHVAPLYSLAVDIKEIPRLLLFSLTAVFLGSLSAAQRSATESLRKARDKLDATVQELKRINAALLAENAERKRVQEALRESEQRLQDIIDNTTAIVFVKDLGLRFVLINREFERRFQVQRDQVCGKTEFEVLPHSAARFVGSGDQQLIESGRPIQFETVAPSIEGNRHYVVAKFLLSEGTGKPYGVCGIATDITESKRAQQTEAALAREREEFALQRAAELGRANQALRGCLDALASVREVDDFLGQVLATMTRQLGAVSSTLRVPDFEQNTLPLELVFQEDRVLSPEEAKYPEAWRNLSLAEQRLDLFLDQPSAIVRTSDPHLAIPEEHRSYLLGLGVKTVLLIPLTSGGQVNGHLAFRFTEERDFPQEDLEIARALATQASLAIQLTRLARTARQSAVLEERSELAGEIHDSLAQFFSGISMQLGMAKEVIETGDDDGLGYVQRASELAQYGLAEARRSAFSLQSTLTEESGLIEALQKLVERTNIPGRLRCNFESHGVTEIALPASARQGLLRIAQEAIGNAVRHAKPTVISVEVRWEPPNVVLEVTDNGSGIANLELASRGGFGLSHMRVRAEKLGAQFDVRTRASRGTSIVVFLPINHEKNGVD